MLIKLDLAKAFDRLCWNYLAGILKAYGFDQSWIKWILSMVSSPIMSILLNGSPSEAFTPSRGLRQGDPLSPFLFILAAEGLGSLVNDQVSREQIKGLQICGEDIPVSHQQFVDDVMLYGQATLKEAQKIIKSLSQFSESFGMEINKDKSKVFSSTPRWQPKDSWLLCPSPTTVSR